MTLSNAAYFDFDVSSTASATMFEAYADLETSAEALAHEHDRLLLLRAIDWVLVERGGPTSRSTASRAAAAAFIQNLPTNRALPRVTVDEDGDLVMIWDDRGRCAVTFEGVTLHMVVNPGANSQHIEPTIYHGGHIHPKLLHNIPVR
jgi:hypothetical protein